MLANSTAAAKKTDQPGICEMQKSYLLNPENSKTFLILSQPKMCPKYIFLLPRAHFLGATCAPAEPVYESSLKTPLSSWPNIYILQVTLFPFSTLTRLSIECEPAGMISVTFIKFRFRFKMSFLSSPSPAIKLFK